MERTPSAQGGRLQLELLQRYKRERGGWELEARGILGRHYMHIWMRIEGRGPVVFIHL
jgi:hypothetical protein